MEATRNEYYGFKFDASRVRAHWLTRVVLYALQTRQQQVARIADLISQPNMWDNLGLKWETVNQRIGCIFGNLAVRDVESLPRVSQTVRSMASSCYSLRDAPEDTLNADRISVLADALEDAGCTDPDILVHLRGSGPRVRGSWVLDIILYKK